MRLHRLAAIPLAVGLCLGGAALAQSSRSVQEYQAPEEVDQQAIAAAKERARTGGINDYGKDVSDQSEPIPWMLIGLVAIIFVGVSPFAWRAYKNAAAEVGATTPRAGARGGGDE